MVQTRELLVVLINPFKHFFVHPTYFKDWIYLTIMVARYLDISSSVNGFSAFHGIHFRSSRSNIETYNNLWMIFVELRAKGIFSSPSA